MTNRTAIFAQTQQHLLGTVWRFLRDPTVSEVMINGFDEIFIERQGRIERTEARFRDEDALQAAMRNVVQFAGKRLDPATSSIETRLPDGTRVHIVQPPAARMGMCVTFRKFANRRLSQDDLIAVGTWTEQVAETLGICVALPKRILVSGGTGSGKTTLLNVLSTMIPAHERIIVLEDSSELQLQHAHVVPFEAQPPDRHGHGEVTIRELLRAALRMRPDRIIVGETRGGEALDMIQAMTSGHAGSMSTCHANSPRDALNRIETMALMSGVEMPLVALRAQVASALDLIVQMARFPDGSRRVTYVTEVLDISEMGRIELRDLFRFAAETPGSSGKGGALIHTGARPRFHWEPALMGLESRIRLSSPLWGVEAEEG